jgi:hypothetical protein
MYPGPPSPPAPQLRPNRVAAGLIWPVAAALAVVATFFDLYHSRSGPVDYSPGFWKQVTTTGSRDVPGGHVPYGVTVVVAAAVVLVAALLVFISRQRRVGMVVGTFGTGMLVAEAVHWTVILLTNPPGSTVIASRLGFWLLIAAAVVGLVALVFAAAERGRPVGPTGYGPPRPQQPPRWEPPTPRYGVPAQQPAQQPPGQPQASQPIQAPQSSQPPPASQSAEADRTVSTNQPTPSAEPTADPDAGQQKSD